jgi:hypothetical protein
MVFSYISKIKNIPVTTALMNLKSLAFGLLLCLSSSSLLAQNPIKDGFIIDLKNDTIRGQIIYRSTAKNLVSCLFLSGGEQKELFPKDILGYGYSNSRFYSSQITQNTFVEVLVEGPLSLYKAKDDVFYVKKDSIIKGLKRISYAAQINEQTPYKSAGTWRGTLGYLTMDCPNISRDRINNLKFHERSFTGLIIDYNDCLGANYTEYKANEPWIKLHLGASIGISSSNLNTRDNSGAFPYLEPRYNSIDPNFGLVFELRFPRLSERVSFQTEVRYINPVFNSSLLLSEGSSATFYDTQIELSTLSFPLSLKYAFPGNRVNWFAQGGFNLDYHLDASAVYQGEQVTGSTVNTISERQAFFFSETQLGLMLGFGVEKTFKKFRAGLALQFFQMNQLSIQSGIYSQLDTNTNRFSLNLTILTK